MNITEIPLFKNKNKVERNPDFHFYSDSSDDSSLDSESSDENDILELNFE